MSLCKVVVWYQSVIINGKIKINARQQEKFHRNLAQSGKTMTKFIVFFFFKFYIFFLSYSYAEWLITSKIIEETWVNNGEEV